MSQVQGRLLNKFLFENANSFVTVSEVLKQVSGKPQYSLYEFGVEQNEMKMPTTLRWAHVEHMQQPHRVHLQAFIKDKLQCVQDKYSRN